MKLKFFLVLLTISTFAVTGRSQTVGDDIEEKAEQITALVLERVSDALNRPVVVVGEADDTLTVVKSADDESNVVTIRIEREYDYNAAENTLNTLRIVAIVVPCAMIAIIVFAVLWFLLMRIKGRNQLIAKAIDNNYQLPDSFYLRTDNRQDAADTANTDAASSRRADPNLPPLPNVPPRPYNTFERRQISNSISLVVAGIIVFLFFISFNAVTPGILFGGIPFAIGASRLACYWYFRNNN